MSMNPTTLEPQPLLAHLLEPTPSSPTDPSRVVRGLIEAILHSGELIVATGESGNTKVRCDILVSAFQGQVQLSVGDEVLVLLPPNDSENGCVLGRVGKYRPPCASATVAEDRVVIEAAEELTLKCGDCSVDLRKDGKLMIRGNDVLTRAKRTQRIKGGTVAIN